MDRFVDLFKKIGRRVYNSISQIAGSKEAKRITGRGEFGDNTVFIDKLAEDILIEELEKELIKCSILTEEKGWVDLGVKYPLIIVDPIDGSLNAKRYIPYYSISLAVATEEKITDLACGYVLNLSNRDEFYAISNKGAFLNDNRFYPQVKDVKVVAVEGLKPQTDSRIVKNIFKYFYRVRQSGSTALDLCYTAFGAYDGFIHLDKSRIIDYAAGYVILKEVGGNLYDFDGKPFMADVSVAKAGEFVGVVDKSLLDKLLVFLGAEE
ncbi:inositol monophosphatase family protein [Hippea jasoniae]|uniref:inositol monophosphatase family protein n=1 Tax=Hippea jasoniae TaxID=944479 RepID=UPI00068A57F9|nr:inositol monophosphatase family protein [Hippea jasoniae]